MNSTIPVGPEGSHDALADDTPADEAETRAFLITRSKRNNAIVPKYFIQNPDRTLVDRSAPLAEFVRNGDLRGLRALLFLHLIISSGAGENGWSTTLPLAVWARVFDTTKTAVGRSSSTSATKVLTRLVERRLIDRSRTGRSRNIAVTLLRPDGSGAAYTRPDGHPDKFVRLSIKFWTDGWHEKLDMAATAMLLVALHEKPGFELPTEHVPAWYGWSADTAERGLKTLRDLDLLEIHKRIKKAPLSPTGATEMNVYRLSAPFAVETPAGTKVRSIKGASSRIAKKAAQPSSLERKYSHIPEAPSTRAASSVTKTSGTEDTTSELK